MNTNENSFKTIARCAPAKWMTDFCKQMKTAGYTVIKDATAGTVVIKLDALVVARGLKMGAMGWMVRANPEVVTAA